MKLPDEVLLRDVTMRDGFQSLSDFIPTGIKISLAKKIIESGVREVEVTSFVSSKHIPQLRDASRLVSLLPKDKNNVTYSALVPNLKGAQAAFKAGIDKLVVVVSASNAHNVANLGKSIRQSLSEFDELFKFTRNNNIPVVGSIAVSFGCPYEGFIKRFDVVRLAEIYFSLGAVSLILADTVGLATPSSVKNLLGCFQPSFLNLTTLHFHNNTGIAMENFLAALNCGVRSFDTTLGGIGGCPNVPIPAGNLSTENVVYKLNQLKVNSRINIEKIIIASNFLNQIIGCKNK